MTNFSRLGIRLGQTVGEVLEIQFANHRIQLIPLLGIIVPHQPVNSLHVLGGMIPLLQGVRFRIKSQVLFNKLRGELTGDLPQVAIFTQEPCFGLHNGQVDAGPGTLLRKLLIEAPAQLLYILPM